MIGIFRPTRDGFLRHARAMRRLWREDRIRRHHLMQLHALERGHLLGILDLWLVWDTQPNDDPVAVKFGGPRYCKGIITTHSRGSCLVVEFAAAYHMRRWIRQAVSVLERHATSKGCNRIEVHCRRGYLQELRTLWTLPIAFERDPGELYDGFLAA